jgi:general stress protein YciG
MTTDEKVQEDGSAEESKPRIKRGFGNMDPAKQREISSKGGKSAHAKGTAHKFTSETARAAGRIPHQKGTAHQWSVESGRAAREKGVGKEKQNG